jgi:hypothetical protein
MTTTDDHLPRWPVALRVQGAVAWTGSMPVTLLHVFGKWWS